MDLLNIICKIAEIDGYKLHFDLAKKNIKYGRKYIVKDGEVQETSISISEQNYVITKNNSVREFESPYETVQVLYDDYINSRPGTHNTRSVFRAKTSDELTYDQLVDGKDREVARCRLEGFIILAAINKMWTWKNPKHWFWLGKNGLVIYKEWI